MQDFVLRWRSPWVLGSGVAAVLVAVVLFDALVIPDGTGNLVVWGAAMGTVAAFGAAMRARTEWAGSRGLETNERAAVLDAVRSGTDIGDDDLAAVTVSRANNVRWDMERAIQLLSWRSPWWRNWPVLVVGFLFTPLAVVALYLWGRWRRPHWRAAADRAWAAEQYAQRRVWSEHRV